MWTFFRGWKRKIGVMALGLACVLMGLWLRTKLLVDHVAFSIGERRHVILAGMGGVIWESYDEDRWFRLKWTTENANDFLARFEPPPDSLTDFTEEYSRGVNGRQWVIFYWSFIVPLTLLSAYLLLIKPIPTPRPAVPDQSLT